MYSDTHVIWQTESYLGFTHFDYSVSVLFSVCVCTSPLPLPHTPSLCGRVREREGGAQSKYFIPLNVSFEKLMFISPTFKRWFIKVYCVDHNVTLLIHTHQQTNKKKEKKLLFHFGISTLKISYTDLCNYPQHCNYRFQSHGFYVLLKIIAIRVVMNTSCTS